MRISLHVWFCLGVFESPACMSPGWSSGAVGPFSLLRLTCLMAPKAILIFPLLLLALLLSPSIHTSAQPLLSNLFSSSFPQTHLCPLGVCHSYPRPQQSFPGTNKAGRRWGKAEVPGELLPSSSPSFRMTKVRVQAKKGVN